MRSNVNKSFLLIFGFLTALLLCELLLKIFWNPPFLNSDYKRNDLEWMQKNVYLNNFGFRNHNLDYKKKDKTIRIFSLGDSYTFGWYINDGNNAYPNYIEKIFSNDGVKYNFDLEVINASQPGFSIDQSIDRFKTVGVNFTPDIVTLGINIFDLLENESPPKKSIFDEVRLYQLTFGNIERSKVARQMDENLKKSISSNSDQITKFEERIVRLNKIVESIGGKFVLVIFPNYDPANPNSDYRYLDYHESIDKIVKKNNISALDLYDAFSRIADKSKLILNPLDAHPSVLAHKIAGDVLLESLKAKNMLDPLNILKQTIYKNEFFLGDNIPNLHSVLSIKKNGDSWVYFDRISGLGIQKIGLNNDADRKLKFMVDYLKTAKSETHEGWPGAQIEYNIMDNDKKIEVNKKLYGYEIVGVHQLTGFINENGSLTSRDLNLSELSIKKDDSKIFINVSSDENFNLYRIIFDISVNQIDIENSKLVFPFKTEIVRTKLKQGNKQATLSASSKVVSLPKFVSGHESYPYIWVGDKLKKIDMVKNENEITLFWNTASYTDSEIEAFVAVTYPVENFTPLTIEYL